MLTTVIAVVAAVAVAAAILAIVLALRPPSVADEQALQAVRNDLNLLRETSDRSIRQLTEIFGGELRNLGSNVQTGLAAVTSEVNNRLDAVNKNVADRLSDNVSAMGATTKAVTDRIANVQETFAGLQKQVGEMSEQARQLAEISKSVSALQHALTVPKARGGFGETQLENLLSQVFAREQYQMQYPFPSGDIADAVLLFTQGKVAIDSKFPLENFARMAEAPSEAEKKARRRDFLKDVRKRIDEVAEKYVRPADGTLPFALMYIPAENVYYETIIRDEDDNDLYSYCLQRRVVPVSPNSLYAYLQTILVGLNSMRISQRAESILREIESLRLELGRFTDLYTTVGKHLKNAGDRFEEGSRALDKLENRVQSLAGNRGEQMELEVEEKRAVEAKGS